MTATEQLTAVMTLLIVLLTLTTTHAQQRRRADDSAYYRSEPIPAHLQPIERAAGSSALGSVYFYGGKKLSSPYSLEVPFYELNDPTINHHFKTFRTLTTLGRLTGLVQLAYVIFQRNRSNGTYWTVFGGSVAATLTFTIIGNSHVNKGVTRYNQLLRQPRVGFSAVPVSATGQMAVGPGVSWGF